VIAITGVSGGFADNCAPRRRREEAAMSG